MLGPRSVAGCLSNLPKALDSVPTTGVMGTRRPLEETRAGWESGSVPVSSSVAGRSHPAIQSEPGSVTGLPRATVALWN